MKIYIEFVIIDNIVIDGLLLWLTNKTLKVSSNPVRIFLAAFLGTVGAIVFSLINIHFFVAFLLKIALGLSMIFVSCGKNKRFFRHFLVFSAYTFVTGGVILGMIFLMRGRIIDALTFSYSAGVPVGVIVGGVAIAVALGVRTVKLLYLKKAENKAKFLNVRLILDKEYELKGLADSGNLLEFEGKKVFFAVSKRLKAVIIEKYSENLLRDTGRNFRVPFSTVSGKTSCLAIKPDGFFINDEKIDCLIAFGKVCSEDFDIIVHG